MEIDIKPNYKIEITLHESDVIKIDLILQNTPYQATEAQIIGNGYYILKLNTTQLTYLLNYFLKKDE